MKGTEKPDTKNNPQGVAAPPQPSLPKARSVSGLGEKYETNPVTGTATLSIPFNAIPGRSGFGPPSSISYDSGAGNGPFGYGWKYSLSTITLKTAEGVPRYLDTDTYMINEADLVPVFKNDLSGNWLIDAKGDHIFDEVEREGYLIRRYRPRIEGSFSRIERWWRKIDGDIHWRTISKDNVLTIYGRDNHSRICDPSHNKHIFSWLVSESYDDKGNAILYEYAAENDEGVDLLQANERNRTRTANRYIKRIYYGNRRPLLLDINKTSFRSSHTQKPDFASADWMFQLVFDYNEAHVEPLLPDPTIPNDEQHEFIEASVSAGDSWSSRPDPFSLFRSGFEIRTYRRCHRVLMFNNFPELGNYPCLVRSLEFDYADFDYSIESSSTKDELEHMGSTRFGSFIYSIRQSGYVRQGNESRRIINGIVYDTYLRKSLPPLELEYGHPIIHDEVKYIEADSLEDLVSGVDNKRSVFVDLDGEGIPGILVEESGSWFYKRNLGGGKFAQMERVDTKPSITTLTNGSLRLMDLEGDGKLDLVQLHGALPGYFERTKDNEWSSFSPFLSIPNFSWKDATLVDLTGDGKADILITEDSVFTWYQSLGEKGFGSAQREYQGVDEEKGARLVLDDGTQSIFLADMNGDGLADIVRIRNGEVCYWSSKGLARYSEKITLDNCPQFDSTDKCDPRRCLLLDWDGSGFTDIVYVRENGIQIYFNQSGNRLAHISLNRSLSLNDLSTIQVCDLFGNGLPCIVWSSLLPGDSNRPMRYIDLWGGQISGKCTGYKNNLGIENKITYASSTKFYLKDKEQGRPWITNLPFPTQCVVEERVYDAIGRNLNVVGHAFHHARYDGRERQFCGFGMAERFETAVFDIGLELLDFFEGDVTNWDPALALPTVLTRTYYHTGAPPDEEMRISKQYAHEYYHEGDPNTGEGELSHYELQSMLLADSILPMNLGHDEIKQASFSLKGMVLRKEIYAIENLNDGTPSESLGIPFVVSELNYSINLVQPIGTENKHAVFFVHPRETIDFQYERKLYEVLLDGKKQRRSDPRVTHNIVLEVDAFGNIRKSFTIGYGRRFNDTKLSIEDQEKQARTIVTYKENKFTNAILQYDDAYRTPLLCESRTFEVVKFNPHDSGIIGITNLFSFDQLQELGLETTEFAQGQWDITYTNVKHIGTTANHPYRRLIEQVETLYRSNMLDLLLPFGRLESLALTGEVYSLAFTPDILATVYARERPQQTPEALLPEPSVVLGSIGSDGGGYVDIHDNDQWWLPSGRIFYSPKSTDNSIDELEFAKDHFFLPHRFLDPFGNNTIVSYDSNEHDPHRNHNILVTETRDPLDNIISTENNYRTVQPTSVTDPNGTINEVLIDALGLVVATAIHKKGVGDSLQNVQGDLTRKQIDDFFLDPKEQAFVLLKGASTFILYDPSIYYLTANPNTPPYTVTVTRETHLTDPIPQDGLHIKISFSYSDGFGRGIQEKIEAEPGPVGGINVISRWIGSGWCILNNKGKVVRKYEPFFDDTHEFRFDEEEGVSSILFYDPVERVVATVHPNHTYEKLVFDPWHKKAYDVNDTILLDPRSDEDVLAYVGRYFNIQPDNWLSWFERRQNGAMGMEEQIASDRTSAHAETPTLTYFDTLGRPFVTVTHNRFSRDGDVLDEKYAARIELDIEGNHREARDAVIQNGDEQGRVVINYDYDMLGNRIHHLSMEAGASWVLNDVTGKPIRAWDDRGRMFRTEYDSLRRPLRIFVTGVNTTSPAQELLTERMVYGEQHPEAEVRNLRGRLYLQLDQCGVMTNENFDFKGNPMISTQRLTKQYKQAVDWRAVDNNAIAPPIGSQKIDLAALQTALEPLLAEDDDSVFTTRNLYDALNRSTQNIFPHSSKAGTKLNVIQKIYNKENLPKRIDVWLELDAEPIGILDPSSATEHFVKNVEYNARGQRTVIEFGNGVSTFYEYDDLTFRLVHLQTSSDSNQKLQDFIYHYDAVGNIVLIHDGVPQTIFFNGEVIKADTHYTYDAIYRLISAEGREHVGQAIQPQTTWNDNFRVNLAHPNDGQKMRNYREEYEYDEVGNISRLNHMIHEKNSGKSWVTNWIRAYEYNEQSQLEKNKTSNRLSSTTVGELIDFYKHDLHGNIVRMPHLENHEDPAAPNMHWNFKDQLKQVDMGGGGTVYYTYDSTGNRIRKIHQHIGALTEERIYLGNYEIYRKYNGNGLKLQRETLHIMDDKERLGLIESRTVDAVGSDHAPRQIIRYQFGNHVGSVSLELDAQAQIISYEEYYSYGSSSYQSGRNHVQIPKRYRYTAKERDEETGFYYHGLRYYSPWLTRWISSDPLLVMAGFNLYSYGKLNPINFVDLKGTQEGPAPGREKKLPPIDDITRELYDMDERYRNLEAATLSGDVDAYYANQMSYMHPNDKAAIPDLPSHPDPARDQSPKQKLSSKQKVKVDPVTDRVEKFLTEDYPSLGAAYESFLIVGSVLMLRQDAQMLLSGKLRLTLPSPTTSGNLAEVPKAPTNVVVRPGQVAASTEFSLQQRILRLVYSMTGGKLPEAGPSKVSGMAVPFSRFNSQDPVLKSLESSPRGTYISPQGAVLTEMPSRQQLAKITRIHGTEFSLSYDPMTQQITLHQGTFSSVPISPGEYFLAHSHPLPSALPKHQSGVYSWWPSPQDVDLISPVGRQGQQGLGQQSSVIVLSSGEAFTYGPW